jgi:hypothetical protein
MVFVSATRLHLRSWWYFPRFGYYAWRSAAQARKADGNLHVGLNGDSKGGHWTCTIWRDEAAMRAFMMSGAHAKAMPHLMEMADESFVVHWTQESAAPPSWPEISSRMKELGRASRLRHPSAAHERFEVAQFS